MFKIHSYIIIEANSIFNITTQSNFNFLIFRKSYNALQLVWYRLSLIIYDLAI